MTGTVPRPLMTWRARFYLLITGARHLSTAGAVLVLEQDLWPQVDVAFPMSMWIAVFLVGGSHLWYAAWHGSEVHARIALAISAVVTSVWAAAFIGAWVGGEAYPIGAILFTALTLKDLTICGEPLQSPFEPIVREYVSRDED